MKQYPCSLFIFRRDLRLHDNTALIDALKKSDTVIVCFILDVEQIGDQNSYKSENCIQFMVESLADLYDQLKKMNGHLFIFSGDPVKIIKNIYNHKKYNALFVNKDYTPYSTARDNLLQGICRELSIDFHAHHDLLLNDPDALVTKTGKPYTIFTPYFKSALALPVKEPQANFYKNYFAGHLGQEANPRAILKDYNKKIFTSGGRRNGLDLLKQSAHLRDYQKTRDYPAITTTGLSAHNKFGTISIREEYYAFKNKFGTTSALVRQLYWRDFYTQIAAHFPHIFGHNFLKKYDQLPWKNNHDDFKKWCTGKTGFPLVDAGMRQLNETGWMHNRVRMVVASFLTKDLQIDWRWGEKYFAQKLIDYDPAVNNGSWQWAASTGCDPQPYFRIFNPWLQQKKFDPECTYIKRWLPELSNLSPKQIHGLYSQTMAPHDYPLPMVDHATESMQSKRLFMPLK